LKSPFKRDFNLGAEVFAAQANFIPGGYLLVLSIAPPASDGTAMLNVTRLWADHCNSILCDRQGMMATSNQVIMLLPADGVDREALDNILTGAKSSPGLPKSLGSKQATNLHHLIGMDEYYWTNKDKPRLNDNAASNSILITS
jgi:hypothetical protein